MESLYILNKNLQPMDNILSYIGNTPMVRLNNIPRSCGLKCEVYAKCEFFTAGDSVKDRIALRMIEEAEKKGLISPGKSVLIEPSSGNTGISLAICAAVKGYRTIVVVPEKNSDEKVSIIRALGAEVIRTPGVPYDAPESYFSVAKRLAKEIPYAVVLDQYYNEDNPMAHYDGTAEEILLQMDNRVDMVVIGAGTGGTLSGVAKKFKEKVPNCKVVGVDPEGSILALPDDLNEAGLKPYLVEGLGKDYVPGVLDRSSVDSWVKTRDKESFLMARRLIKEEGLLCGGSSGSVVSAALIAAKDLEVHQRVVVVLPDSTRNYMTKFLSDAWMIEKDFIKPTEMNLWWSKVKVSCLPMTAPVTVVPDLSCQEAVALMQNEGYDQLPVVDDNSLIKGVVTLGSLMTKIVSGKVKPSSPVSQSLYPQFQRITPDTSLGKLSTILHRHHFALVVHTHGEYSGGSVKTKETCIGIVTQIDLLTYITKETSIGGAHGAIDSNGVEPN